MKANQSFNTLAMIFSVVVLAAFVTWVSPGGEYAREVVNGRTLVVPNSFTHIQSQPQGVGALLMAPIKGFIQAANIIVFLFVIGGAFMIIQKTGAVSISVQRMAFTFSQKPHLQKYFIPVSMTIFSIGGAVFGSSEETLPFILIFVMLALSLGYDSLVGVAIPFLGTAAGFAGSVLNPFTVGIAQSIAELPLYSGIEFRIVIWLISTVSMIVFVARYAAKVRKDPRRSPVYDLDQARRKDFHVATNVEAPFTRSHQFVLATFAAAILFLIVGILKFGWYINEIGALFLGLGILCGFMGKLTLTEITDGFREGARDMVGVALIIGCARAILVIATDGKILDLMLFTLANMINGVHPVFAAQMMFVMQCVINFFVHSASGQAMLTMPVMAPLADVVGITRQTAVLAFQFGEGWINPILPTSGVTMGVLGLANIPWGKWFRWMLPVQIYFVFVAMILLAVAVLIRYQ
jgi:uncharacterized ion transporter superfamily protein YfcC